MPKGYPLSKISTNPTPDVSGTGVLDEGGSGEESLASDSPSSEAATTTVVGQPSQEATPLDQSGSGNGSWLFFGGVGLLLVGVLLLLVWRRQG